MNSRWILRKRNFLVIVTVLAGAPTAVFFLWSVRDFTGVGLRLSLLVLALGGALVAAVLLWEVLIRLFPSQRPDERPDSLVHANAIKNHNQP